MTGRVGVAISTTGDEYRLDNLQRCVAGWSRALDTDGGSLFVTVDGDEAAAELVRQAVYDWTGSVYRVGQPHVGIRWGPEQPRLGVAANKNTGLELLMNVGAGHLFLCDDDTWPLYSAALDKHTQAWGLEHSMVCWGQSRLAMRVDTDGVRHGGYAAWTWPRGVLLYATRGVVETVGGMDERFGPGGHEHVEWSQRIHNAGLTPAPFLSPASYAETGPSGKATRASVLWHCEDMRKPGETLDALSRRKKASTSVRRAEGDWDRINTIMAECEGRSDFVHYQSSNWGRASATLCSSIPASLGAEESK